MRKIVMNKNIQMREGTLCDAEKVVENSKKCHGFLRR
jgi:hypothetical protein